MDDVRYRNVSCAETKRERGGGFGNFLGIFMPVVFARPLLENLPNRCCQFSGNE